MNNIAESNRVIKRDRYLNKIISYMWDGQIKVITGIRRCGKSYLLDKLFRQYLLDQGVDSSHILSFALDLAKDIKYRNPLELAACVRNTICSLMKFKCPMRWKIPITKMENPLPFTMH